VNKVWLLLVVALALPARSDVLISEFMADNTRTLRDEDGNYSDWIEILNDGTTTVDLAGYSLTDTTNDLRKWTFPSTNISANGTLVVFASGKDRRVPGRPLHANFKLATAGEYLALTDSSGTNILTQFAPAFPPQLPDISFGFGIFATNINLIGNAAPVHALVPSVANGGSALEYNWTGTTNHEPFDDSSWRTGVTGVGFSASTEPIASPSLVLRFDFNSSPVGDVIADSKPYGVLHNGLNHNATWLESATDAAKVTRTGVMDFSASSASQLTVADNADFDTTEGTIAFWFRSSGVAGGGNYGAMIMDRRTSQGDVIVQQDDGRIFIQPEQMYGAASSRNVSDGAWHHIA